MKLANLKEFAPIIATIAGLALISTVVHAARVESPSPTKTRPMVTASCSPTPTPTPSAE